jgi:capsular exopolysaccharide synthesis family protein
MFRRWRWVLIALALIVPSIIGAVTRLQPDSYTAVTTIYPTQEAIMDPTWAGLTLRPFAPQDPKTYRGNLVGLLKTRGVWEKAITDKGLGVSFDDFKQRLDVTMSQDRDLIQISWPDNDPERAVTIVNSVTDGFAQYYEDLQTGDATKTRQVYEQQQAAASVEVQKAAEELRNFQESSTLLSKEEAAALKTEYLRLESQRRDVMASLESARARAGTLADQLSQKPLQEPLTKQTGANKDRDNLRIALVQSEAKMAEYRTRYNPSHPKRQELQSTIDKLEREVRATGTKEFASEIEQPNPVHQQLEQQSASALAEADGYAQQLEAVTRSVAEMQQRMAILPHQSFELEKLLQAQQVAEESHRRITQSLDEARATEESAKQKVRIRVIDRASSSPENPLEPTDKRLRLKVAMAFLLSIFLGVLFIMLLEQADNRIKGPTDLERLVDIRVLSSVPVLPAEEPDARAPAEVQQEYRFRLEAFHESFRALRSQIALTAGADPSRAIGVASARTGEGRTTVAVNLAESIAHGGESVVLVDANLRQPAIHLMYDVPNETGLSSVMRGETMLEAVLRETDIPGLRVLTAGPPTDDPAMLLGSPALHGAIESLRRSFSRVVVDLPPGLAFVDSIITAKELDGVVLVVSAGQVVRGAEDRLLGDLESSGVRIFGAVVNKVLPQHSDALFHYQKAAAAADHASGGQA